MGDPTAEREAIAAGSEFTFGHHPADHHGRVVDEIVGLLAITAEECTCIVPVILDMEVVISAMLRGVSFGVFWAGIMRNMLTEVALAVAGYVDVASTFFVAKAVTPVTACGAHFDQAGISVAAPEEITMPPVVTGDNIDDMGTGSVAISFGRRRGWQRRIRRRKRLNEDTVFCEVVDGNVAGREGDV